MVEVAGPIPANGSSFPASPSNKAPALARVIRKGESPAAGTSFVSPE